VFSLTRETFLRTHRIMSIAPWLLVFFLASGGVRGGDRDTGLPPAVDMFPADTQAFLWLPNSDAFLDNWGKTELGKLAADERLQDFWSSQQESIRRRLAEAGWQLSIKFEDLKEICSGQAAMGWISRPEQTSKPYSLGMVVDVKGRDEQLASLMERIETEMAGLKAVGESIDAEGVSVRRFALPNPNDAAKVRETYYANANGQLLAADDLLTIRELVASQSSKNPNALSRSPLYEKVQSRIARDSHPSELEYFVRPIGFGKLLRAVSGKPARSQADILKILESEGFDRLLCAAGSVQFNKVDLDMHHQGYILREEELPTSVQILDFPNQPQLIPPPWIHPDSASVLGFSWNFSQAFPKFRGIVDAYIGDEQFEEILEGIKLDPNGPQIDIKKEILPYIETEFFAVTRIVQPITPESKRSLICVKLNDPENKLTGVLNRYSKTEPGASTEDIGEYRIWKFSNEEIQEETLEFDSIPGAKSKAAEERDAPLLKQWAVSLIDGYFVFASNPETLTEAIERASQQATESEFEAQSLVMETRALQQKLVSGEGMSFSEVDLSERSFEMQYELFRQDILPQSRSLLALILERVFKTDKAKPQQLQGGRLPPFEQVKGFFTPAGMVVRTEKDGWGIDGFVLGKKER